MKKTNKFNFRVEVEPKGNYWGRDTEKDWLQKCEDIKSQVERHVDSVINVFVVYDTEDVCSFCGFAWEVSEAQDEDWLVGEPTCCTKASDEWRENQGVK